MIAVVPPLSSSVCLLRTNTPWNLWYPKSDVATPAQIAYISKCALLQSITHKLNGKLDISHLEPDWNLFPSPKVAPSWQDPAVLTCALPDLFCLTCQNPGVLEHSALNGKKSAHFSPQLPFVFCLTYNCTDIPC